MKKNIKILFTLLIAFTIMLPFSVRADTDYSIDTSPISTGNTSGGSSGGGTWGFPSSTTKGVRITVTDNNGNKLANSRIIDFLEDNLYTYGRPVYYNKYKTYKRDSYNSSGFFTNVGPLKDTAHNTALYTGKHIKEYFDLSLSDQLKCNGALDWSCIRGYLVGVTSNETNLITFLKKFGVTYDKYKAVDWFFIVEPIFTMQYSKNGNVQAFVVGTMTELKRDFDAEKTPMNEANNNYDHVGKTVMSYSKTTFKGATLSSTFSWAADNKNVGLIWLGLNAATNIACPSGTDKAGQMVLPSTCTTSCSPGLSYSSSNCCDVACKNSNRTCGEYASNSSIWKDGWIYNSANANKVVNAGSSISTIRVACGRQLSCSDYYNTSTDFKNVILYSGASATNCCSIYENLYAGNTSVLRRLYRDHPECYSCTYTEKGINASCSSGNNYSSAGDKFGRGTADYDEQTCAYYISAGKINTASSELVTRRVINQSCKVVCTETVNIQFPLVAKKYYMKGSYIVWPTNVALNETESQLVLNGNTKCWYYVNKVRLNNLYRTDLVTANSEFNQCIDDVYSTYNNNKNIINYDLKGNFSVKYNDSEYGKEVMLTRDQIGNVSYNHSYANNENILNNLKNNGGSRGNIDVFVSLVETISYTVNQTVNYKISPNYGYNYIYHNKFYTKNMWGTNAIDIGQSVLGLKNKPYNDGKLEIDYNSIGGGSKTYSNTTQTYGTCKYVTTDNDIHVCPIGTKNVSMPLDEIMIRESLSYDEAVSKYCDLSDMTVCDSNTYHAGKPILKSCYDNTTCRELTCNIHECTDREGTCHILNDCMTRQVEDYGKTLEEAKKICTNRFCDGSFGNIEYRVIDLKNPFPGNQASVGSSRLFNTDIQGRKPGSNWNSITVVKNEILENRGVTGDNIYNLTPLYEFKLTPSVIKNIRKYNDTHEYDDFTLSCKGSSKQACVSSGFNFRSKDYGFVSAINECQNISNLTSFNSCYNNDSTLRY